MDVDSDGSIDEEMEESLPICVQGNLTRMRKEKQDMLRIEKNLQTQLEKSRSLARDLEVEVESLKTKVRLLEDRLEEEEGAVCDHCDRTRLEMVSSATQTSESGLEVNWSKDIAEEVRDIASSTMERQGLVLEETSGRIFMSKLKYLFTRTSLLLRTVLRLQVRLLL